MTRTGSEPWAPAVPVGYRCRRRHRCADRVSVRDPDAGELVGHAGAELDDYDGLCDACRRAVAAAVRDLARDYTELHLALGRAGRSPSDWAGTAVAGSASPAVPIQLQLEALARDVVEHATRWAQIVADHHRQPVDRFDDGRPAVRLGHAVRLLSHPAALATLLTLDPQDVMLWHRGATTVDTLDGIAGALQLLRLHEDVEHACGRAELVHRLPAHCARCERPSLIRRNGKAYVECTRCGDRAPESHYNWLVRVLADEQAAARPELARMTA